MPCMSTKSLIEELLIDIIIFIILALLSENLFGHLVFVLICSE